MNWVLSIFLFILVSCGNNSVTTQQTVKRPQEERTGKIEGECIEDVCYEASPVLGEYKILESVIDAKVTINEGSIFFDETKNSNSSLGELICDLNVFQGEEFKYELTSGKLRLDTKEKSMLLQKSTDDLTLLTGTWVWRGLELTKKIVFTMTILDNQRVIIRKSCEA